MSEIIRAFQLKKGDLFIKQGTCYVVSGLTDGGIVYSWWSGKLKSRCGTYGRIGAKSQERVEYVGMKPKKKLTKPFKKNKFYNIKKQAA
jgi:hypothetical protein